MPVAVANAARDLCAGPRANKRPAPMPVAVANAARDLCAGSTPLHPAAECCCCFASRRVQKCEPSFGAIPSVAEQQKKQAQAEQAAERRDEILEKVLQHDALLHLAAVDVDEPETVERIKHQLFGMWHREEITLDNPVSLSYVKQLLNAEKAAAAPTFFNRNRFGDDDDSDIDLDGL